MKNQIMTILGLGAIFMVGCGEKEETKAPCNRDHAKKVAPAEVPEPAEAPAKEGQLALSPANSSVAFVGAKMVGDHAGSFQAFSGTVDFKGGDPSSAQIKVKIDLSSVKTDSPQLDGHLKSPDFFDVAKFPEAAFESSQVTKNGGDAYTVTGELNLHGVTKEIAIPATITVTDKEATMKASFKINRKDFGIVYPGMPDNLIKDDVSINLSTKAAL